MVGHGEVEAERSQDGGDQPLGLAQRQAERRPQRQAMVTAGHSEHWRVLTPSAACGTAARGVESFVAGSPFVRGMGRGRATGSQRPVSA